MANPEHLEILKQGVAVWNTWREENPEVQPDLMNADLEQANLQGVAFYGANLQGADLTRANLQEADLMLADLRAAVWPGLDGIVVSRAESADQIAHIDGIISSLESERGLLPGSVEVVASLETAPGNHSGFEIATASPRIWGLTLGRADLIMDLRPEPSGEIHLMQYLMQRLVTIAAAAGKTPLGAWWRHPDRGLLATPTNTREAARRGRAIGFKGSFCVLDNQVGPLNEGFSPTEPEVQAARAIQQAYTHATESGTIATVSHDARMLTPDIVRQYANVVHLADAIATREMFKAAAVEGRPVPLP